MLQNGIVAGQQLLALSETRGQKFWTLDPDGIEEQDWIIAGRFAWETLGISSNENLELVLSQPANATSLLGTAVSHFNALDLYVTDLKRRSQIPAALLP